MADSVSSLFKEEEEMLSSSNDKVIIDLEKVEDKTKEEEEKKEEQAKEEELPKEEEVKEEETPKESAPSNDRVSLSYNVIGTYYGTLTGYGADCYGCSGKTRSGYDLTKSVYYDDAEYGKVRILAADADIGRNAIIRVSNVPGMDPFLAIVLDTGGNVGKGKGALFDLAFSTEGEAMSTAYNVTFELLRKGIPW